MRRSSPSNRPARHLLSQSDKREARRRAGKCSQIADYLAVWAGGCHRHLEYRSARSGGSQPRHAEPWGTYSAGSSSRLARNHERSGGLRGARHGNGLGYSAVSIDDPGAGRVVCHGRAGRMSPGLVMAGTGGNPGSPRCWTYEPGFIPGRDRTESVMKNSQRAGSQDDRAGTARMRRWSEEKLSVRLFLVAFVLVLTGALVWAGWFASASQNATWTPVLVSIAVVGAVAPGTRRSWMSRSR